MLRSGRLRHSTSFSTRFIQLVLDKKPPKIHCLGLQGKYWKLKSVDQVNDQLEAHQLSLSAMKNSPFYLTFAKEVNHWVRTLNDVSETLEMQMQVQRQWSYLESIFMDSVDIRTSSHTLTLASRLVLCLACAFMTRRYCLRFSPVFRCSSA